ncbi:MAG: NAD-dependent epimerase/dehydratase family protein [Candidatus Lokiarchaeota archaeon]|nr:NAD-dependent epimerase/dehydratase family protein [Candidatus Lokiarchaeota archaeon]
MIYHLAAIPSDWWNKSILRVNYRGTENILELAIKNDVKRFIFMSSLVVHGFKDFDGASEETPIINKNSIGRPYIRSKVLCEELINNRKNEIETVIIRPGFTIFGQNDLMFTYDLIHTLESGGFYAFLNGGNAKMCYSYVQNLVDGLILAGTHENAANETFILCDSQPEYTTLRDITDLICEELELEVPKTSIPYWLAYPFVSFFENIARLFGKKKSPRLTVYRLKVAKYDLFFKSDKAQELIGYNPKTDLKTAIKNSIAWYKKYKKIKNP